MDSRLQTVGVRIEADAVNLLILGVTNDLLDDFELAPREVAEIVGILGDQSPEF